MFWFFGHEACGTLASQSGIEPEPPALEDEVLTTGPPGKSRVSYFNRAPDKPKGIYCEKFVNCCTGNG